MSHLNLSEQQMRLIHSVADTLQPALRQQFLASIVDNLDRRGSRISDPDIMAAIESVRTALAYSYNDYDDCR